MSEQAPIRDEQILTGALFSEPMRVETVRPNGTGSWLAGLVGTETERFRSVSLTGEDLAGLTISGSSLSYDADGRLLRLGLEAHALGIAHEFDPYFGLSISRVDPLPHQLEAVYGHLLKLSTVRFLLADDAGAGKTIMAGLLVRELMLRGLVERILVVCPANLAFQWQRELREKFDEKFLVLKGSDIRDQFGVNQWMEQKRVITSLDLAKRDDILPGLRQVHWDLVIVDEAHRMSWSPPAKKTARYALGEWNARPVFTKRIPQTVDFKIDDEEWELYREISRFVKRQSGRAAAEGDDPRARAIRFLMALYQRRLASSTYAMRRSLENRARRLEEGLKHAQTLARKAPRRWRIPEPRRSSPGFATSCRSGCWMRCSWRRRDDSDHIRADEPEISSTDRSGRIMTLVVPLTGGQS